MPAAPDTILVITGNGISPYSARGLKQTVDPIDASIKLERDVNGNLVDLSIPSMRKYKSKITCTDVNAPAFGGLYPGSVVTVDCAWEFSYPTATPALQDRPAVVGSIRTDGDYTFYRPQLTMVVRTFNNEFVEYDGTNGWELNLEEQ